MSNSFEAIQFDDNDVPVSKLGQSVQIGLTSATSWNVTGDTTSFIELLRGADSTIKVFVAEREIADENDAGALNLYITVDAGVIKTQATAPQPFVVEYEVRTGGSAFSSRMSQIRLVLPDLSDKWEPLPPATDALVSSGDAASNVKAIANAYDQDTPLPKGVYDLGPFTAEPYKIGAAYLPKIYAYVNSDGRITADNFIELPGADQGSAQYLAVCNGNVVGTPIAYTDLQTAVHHGDIHDKFVAFVHVNSTYGFHLVPELVSTGTTEQTLGNMIRALIIDEQYNLRILTGVHAGSMVEPAEVRLHIISDLVNPTDLAFYSSEAMYKQERPFRLAHLLPQAITISGETALKAGFVDLNKPELSFELQHRQTISGYLGSNTLNASVSEGADTDGVLQSVSFDGTAENIFALPTKLDFTRTAAAFEHNTSFGVSISLAWNAAHFLGGVAPTLPAPKSITFSDFLQGMFASATYRGNDNEIELDNEGKAVETTVVEPSNKTTTSFELASTAGFMVGDELSVAEGHAAKITAISDTSITFAPAAPNNTYTSVTITKNVLAHVTIHSPVKFSNVAGNEMSYDQFKLMANQEEKTSKTLTRITRQSEGVYEFTITALADFSANEYLELPKDILKQAYLDLDLFARGHHAYTFANNVLTVTTYARDDTTLAIDAPQLVLADVIDEAKLDTDLSLNVDIINTTGAVELGWDNLLSPEDPKKVRSNDTHGNYQLEILSQEDHSLNFLVRHVDPTGFTNTSTSLLNLSLYAKRSLGVYSSASHVLLPFPTTTLSENDDNEVDETAQLSSQSSVRQGLSGIELVTDGNTIIAGEHGTYARDMGEIKTHTKITGYFGGSYAVGKVVLNQGKQNETNLHQTFEASAIAGRTVITPTTVPSDLVIDQDYELAITAGQPANSNPVFAEHTRATWKGSEFHLDKALVGALGRNNADESVTYYKKDAGTSGVETVANGDLKVILKPDDVDADDARVYIQQDAGAFADGDTLTFRINNSGTGQDFGAFTINVTTLRPEATMELGSIDTDETDHVPRFKMTYNITSADTRSMLGDLQVQEFVGTDENGDRTLTGASYATIEAFASDADLTDKVTNTLIKPASNFDGEIVYRARVLAPTNLDTSTGYDFYGRTEDPHVGGTQITRNNKDAYVQDTEKETKDHPELNPVYTNGQTGFVAEATDFFNFTGTGLARTVAITWDGAAEDIAITGDNTTSAQISIPTLKDSQDGKKITFTVTNIDNQDSHSHLLVGHEGDLVLNGQSSAGRSDTVTPLTKTITLTVHATPTVTIDGANTRNWLYEDGVAKGIRYQTSTVVTNDTVANNLSLTPSEPTTPDGYKYLMIPAPNAAETQTVTVTYTIDASNRSNNYGVAALANTTVSDSVTITWYTTPVKQNLPGVNNEDKIYFKQNDQTLFVAMDERDISTTAVVEKAFTADTRVNAYNYSVLPTASVVNPSTSSITITANENSYTQTVTQPVRIGAQFASGATAVCGSSFSVDAASTVKVTYEYSNYYTATFVDTELEHDLSWTVNTTAFNPERVTERLDQYYRPSEYKNEDDTTKVHSIKKSSAALTTTKNLTGGSITFAYDSGDVVYHGATDTLTTGNGTFNLSALKGMIAKYTIQPTASKNRGWIHLNTTALTTTDVLISTTSSAKNVAIDDGPAVVKSDKTHALYLLSTDGATAYPVTADTNNDITIPESGESTADASTIVSFYTKVIPGIVYAGGAISFSNGTSSTTIPGTWRSNPGNIFPAGTLSTVYAGSGANSVAGYVNMIASNWTLAVEGQTFKYVEGDGLNDFFRTDALEWNNDAKDSSSGMSDIATGNSTLQLASFSDTSVSHAETIHASYKMDVSTSSSFSTAHPVIYNATSPSDINNAMNGNDKIHLEPHGGAITDEDVDGVWQQATRGAGEHGWFVNVGIKRGPTKVMNGIDSSDLQNPAAVPLDLSHGIELTISGDAGDDQMDITAVKLVADKIGDSNSAAGDKGDFENNGTASTITLTAQAYFKIGTNDIYHQADDTQVITTNLNDRDVGNAGQNPSMKIIASTYASAADNLFAVTDAIPHFAANEANSLRSLRHVRGGCAVIEAKADVSRKFMSNTAEEVLNEVPHRLSADKVIQTLPMANVHIYKLGTPYKEDHVDSVSELENNTPVINMPSHGISSTDGDILVVATNDLSSDSEEAQRGFSHHLSGVYEYNDANSLKRKIYSGKLDSDHTSFLQGSTNIAVQMWKLDGLTAESYEYSDDTLTLSKPTVIAGLEVGESAFHKIEEDAPAKYAFVAEKFDGLVWGFQMHQDPSKQFIADREVQVDEVMDVEARRLQSSADDTTFEARFRPVPKSSDTNQLWTNLRAEATVAAANIIILHPADEDTIANRAMLHVSSFFA